MVGFLALCAVLLACTGEGEGKGRGLSGESNPNAPAQCSEPRKYIKENAYDDDSEFWSSLASNLTKQYGMGWSANAQPCRQYGDEESFLAVVSMVRDKEDPSPTDLQEKVSAFCEAHSDDSRVDEAFNCSTGCPLADLLNQICLQARPPLCIEPVSNCTNTRLENDFACGKGYSVYPLEELAYSFYPCGYPRCPEACLITYTLNDVTDAELKELHFSLRANVICPDTLTIYYGSDRNDNILLNSTCIEEGDAENFFDVGVNMEMRTITIAIDKSPGGSGTGYDFAFPTGF